jgi:hypothetical protein
MLEQALGGAPVPAVEIPELPPASQVPKPASKPESTSPAFHRVEPSDEPRSPSLQRGDLWHPPSDVDGGATGRSQEAGPESIDDLDGNETDEEEELAADRARFRAAVAEADEVPQDASLRRGLALEAPAHVAPPSAVHSPPAPSSRLVPSKPESAVAASRPAASGHTPATVAASATSSAAPVASMGGSESQLNGASSARFENPPDTFPRLAPAGERPKLLLKIGTDPRALILSEGQALRRCVQKGWLWKKADTSKWLRRWSRRYFRVVVHTKVQLLNEEAAMLGAEQPEMDEIVTAAWLLYYADDLVPEPKETIDLFGRTAAFTKVPSMAEKYPSAFEVAHDRRRIYYLRPDPKLDEIGQSEAMLREEADRWIATINAAVESINELFITRFRRAS